MARMTVTASSRPADADLSLNQYFLEALESHRQVPNPQLLYPPTSNAGSSLDTSTEAITHAAENLDIADITQLNDLSGRLSDPELYTRPITRQRIIGLLEVASDELAKTRAAGLWEITARVAQERHFVCPPQMEGTVKGYIKMVDTVNEHSATFGEEDLKARLARINLSRPFQANIPANTACLFCRRRKIKCDGSLPQCDMCLKHRQAKCEYPQKSHYGGFPNRGGLYYIVPMGPDIAAAAASSANGAPPLMLMELGKTVKGYAPPAPSGPSTYIPPRSTPTGNTNSEEGHEDHERCANCDTAKTSLWRKDEDGRAICNACQIYFRVHGRKRPKSMAMASSTVKKRSGRQSRPSGHALPRDIVYRFDTDFIPRQDPPRSSDHSLPSPGESTEQQQHLRVAGQTIPNFQQNLPMSVAGLAAPYNNLPPPIPRQLAPDHTFSPDQLRGTSNEHRQTAINDETEAQASKNINDKHKRRSDDTAHGQDREIPKRVRLEKSSASAPPVGGKDFVPPQNTHSGDVVLSRHVSSEEMFQCLVDHGCADLSSYMDPDRYSAGLIMGGAFGDIWKGRLRDGTEVAIKMWRFCSILQNGPKSMKRAMREIYYWSKAKHTNVQELMGVIMFQGRLGMVSLWMDHGNLREYICKYPDVDRYLLCVQVVTGVRYLHSCKMIHGDLKAANVLVSRDGVAKLSDFDHSIMAECSLAFSETSKLGGGTTRWMAPELILDDDSHRNEYTDIYALGMTMLEIITGNSPYYPECKEDVHVIKAVMQGRLPKRQTTHFGDNTWGNQMWELLLRCWSREPTTRPTAAGVYESLSSLTSG